jgi:hypothetical protein
MSDCPLDSDFAPRPRRPVHALETAGRAAESRPILMLVKEENFHSKRLTVFCFLPQAKSSILIF